MCIGGTNPTWLGISSKSKSHNKRDTGHLLFRLVEIPEVDLVTVSEACCPPGGHGTQTGPHLCFTWRKARKISITLPDCRAQFYAKAYISITIFEQRWLKADPEDRTPNFPPIHVPRP
ncbi:hypothetical protein AVEN_239865-1 [Araneus ventricosus]|uniref:Uncharacterized protein n=1 Tax=Araneus ventricosus TaxID=182803 RepID=A0A4Y2F871_ARAVE|nr:hypothetical protein AVEN_239865-1 [Araneus ventricosus]